MAPQKLHHALGHDRFGGHVVRARRELAATHAAIEQVVEMLTPEEGGNLLLEAVEALTTVVQRQGEVLAKIEDRLVAIEWCLTTTPAARSP